MTQPRNPPARFTPFAYGFRPFFLLAGVFAFAAMGYWLWLYPSGKSPLAPFAAHLWHGHELIFGFITSAMAGFLLTAVPSWTGSRGFGGAPLVLLTLLWLAGRAGFLAGSALPWPVLAGLELAFLPALAGMLAPALLRARNRNTAMLLVVLALWASDAVFLYALGSGRPALASHALTVGLDVVLLLVTIIGGRIVPAFTGNALRRQDLQIQMVKHPGLERLVIGAMLLLVLADALAPRHGLTAGIATLAGLAHVWRLAGWHGLKTRGQPIVWVLHLAYAWLPLGLFLKAAALSGAFAWAAFWQHALGAGAAAMMIMAVMSRAALGHTGRPLRTARSMTWCYVLLTLAALTRVFGPFLLPLAYAHTLLLSGAAWMAAFGIYLAVYAPILLRPRVDGKPG